MKRVLMVCACALMLCPIAAFAQRLIPRDRGWGDQPSTSKTDQPQEPRTIPGGRGRDRELPDSRGPVIDLSQRMKNDPADQVPSDYYEKERTSDRKSVSGQAPAARYARQDSQPFQNNWKEKTANSPTENATMNFDDEQMNVKSISKTYRIPTGAGAIPGANTFSDMISKVGVGPLRWTNTGLTSTQRQFLDNVRNAQQSGAIDVYTSYRQRIQFIEDPDGACVVYVSPNSRLRGLVAVGDVIMEMDGKPILSPWDVELHYRWTKVEKVRWQDGVIKSFWVWLGTF